MDGGDHFRSCWLKAQLSLASSPLLDEIALLQLRVECPLQPICFLKTERHAQRELKAKKRVETDRVDSVDSDLELPRSRDGTFDPATLTKGQRRLPGFDEKVLVPIPEGGGEAADRGPSEGTERGEVPLEDMRALQTRPLDAL